MQVSAHITTLLLTYFTRSLNNVFRSGWIVFAPVALLAIFAPSASAEPIVGLNAVGYAYTTENGIPQKSDTAYPICHSETEDNINRNFEGEPFGDCPNDFFLIHYTGFIQIPEHQTIEFWVAADDGGTVKIGDQEFGDWNLKGCSATETGLLDISAGTQPLDGWFYEWGGGTCYMLAWNIDGAGWEIVPAEAFTNEPLATTTTTTTTILQEQTSTSNIPSSTYATTTTEQLPNTTSTATPQYTTTPFIEPTISPTTTETTIEAVPDTELPTPISEPAISTPTTNQTTTTYIQDTSVVDITVGLEVPAPTPLDTIFEAPTGNEEGALEAHLAFEQVLQVLSSPEALSQVSAEQAQILFASVVVEELSDAEIEQLTEVVQDAPEDVRQAFEKTIDIFGSGFDNYQPLGSTITVAQRRAVVAVTAVLFAIPAPIPQRRRL